VSKDGQGGCPGGFAGAPSPWGGFSQPWSRLPGTGGGHPPQRGRPEELGVPAASPSLGPPSSPSAFYPSCPKTGAAAFRFPLGEPAAQPRFLLIFAFFFFISPDAEEPEILWLSRVFIGEIYIFLYVGYKAALGKREGLACIAERFWLTHDCDSPQHGP